MAKALLFLICLVFSGASWACSCFHVGPQPCRLQPQAAAIFIGTVISIENPPPAPYEFSDASGLSRYRFALNEAFTGVFGQEIDVYSGRGKSFWFASCFPAFFALKFALALQRFSRHLI